MLGKLGERDGGERLAALVDLPVVYAEALEVACDDVALDYGGRLLLRVVESLLERRLHLAASRLRLVEVGAEPLLLDNHACIAQLDVGETGVVMPLKDSVGVGVLDAETALKEVEPERLAFAALVFPATLPALRKFRSRFALLGQGHPAGFHEGSFEGFAASHGSSASDFSCSFAFSSRMNASILPRSSTDPRPSTSSFSRSFASPNSTPMFIYSPYFKS